MPNFMQFTTLNGRTVYINRDHISLFSHDEKSECTQVSLVGDENLYELQGDQIQKILDGWREW